MYANKGKLINKIFNRFKKDTYFKKKYPKSLDRNYFKNFFNELIKYKSNNAIHTATMMTIYGIINGLNLINNNVDLLILTGGGGKNLFLNKQLKKKLSYKKINIKKIDEIGLSIDNIESQMFGYLAVRSIKKLPLSSPNTTGVNNYISGGIKYGKLIKN